MKRLIASLILVFLLTSTGSARSSIHPTPLGAGTPPATARLSCDCGHNRIDYTTIDVSSNPRIVKLKDLSKGKETYIRWDFGDGTHLEGTKNIPSLKNPVHHFPRTGYYISCLTIKCGSCGNSLWFHKNIVIT
jgi:hypothetical protein